MVEAAASADVGIHPIPLTNRQAPYCLPDKIFGYTMAGLALCVSDLPELRRVVEDYGLGITMDASSPEAIARAVNSLDGSRISAFRKAARRARVDLNWQVEQVRLLSIYDDLGPPRKRSG
jgi:glycosyltransferase involved in cell wall biosynthesis